MLSVYSNDSFSSNITDVKMMAAPSIPDEVEFSRGSSFTKIMDSFHVNNDKVRYYYNKTIGLRAPIQTMIDALNTMHGCTYAYLSQTPISGDYSVISTLFELIPMISTLIDWESLNHSCYWDDFCRETKQLMILVEKVNGAALKSGDTMTDVLTQAQYLFQEVVSNDNRIQLERAIAYRQPTDYLNDEFIGQNIQIRWQRAGDIIELLWHDADGGVLKISLNQTGTGFRLRFLRHLIYHARSCLEFAFLTFAKLNIELQLNIPIQKLEKCDSISLQQLTPHERACLTKAKREFDDSLDLMWRMLFRFKFQTFQLLKYKTTFKGMRRTWKYAPKTVPTFEELLLNVDDSLLMRVIGYGIQAQAKDESFDFTVFPDRTEDIISKVEDLIYVECANYKKLQMIMNIITVTLPDQVKNFTANELASIKDEIRMIFVHRFQIRRCLKKCLEIFENHPAFQKMDKLKLLTPVKSVSLKGHSDTYIEESTDASESYFEDADISTFKSNESKVEGRVWIEMIGGVKATMDDSNAIIIEYFHSGAVKQYLALNTDERIILNIRLIRHLLSFVANEQCHAKVLLNRVTETKSLVKRLKVKDRLNADLQNIIVEQSKQIRLMLQLTKNMRLLKEHLR